jgi:S1-C subfamily serine protease
MPRELSSWIQVNMNINGGNSGGPVFIQGGDLMGIVIWGARPGGTGIDFVMPISEALGAVGL